MVRTILWLIKMQANHIYREANNQHVMCRTIFYHNILPGEVDSTRKNEQVVLRNLFEFDINVYRVQTAFSNQFKRKKHHIACCTFSLRWKKKTVVRYVLNCEQSILGFWFSEEKLTNSYKQLDVHRDNKCVLWLYLCFFACACRRTKNMHVEKIMCRWSNVILLWYNIVLCVLLIGGGLWKARIDQLDKYTVVYTLLYTYR